MEEHTRGCWSFAELTSELTSQCCAVALRRSTRNLTGLSGAALANTLWRAPLVWVALNLLRFCLLLCFKPVFWITAHLNWYALTSYGYRATPL